MGNNRGDQALRVLTPVAMREIGYALGVGLVGALAWKFTMADSTRARIAKLNKDYESKRSRDRKQFEAWLATQPYDDE